MITNSTLVLVSPQGDRSYVIEDHHSDDGRIMRVEGLRANGDFQAAMIARVPSVEAELAAESVAQEAAVDAVVAQQKIDDFVSGLDLTEIGLTQSEVVAFTID